ncbi:FIMAH domain-containing protein [Actinoplanes sp. NPDC049681]|uniref:FIMAH domain-containing protein n=1 Tax=Actinoplanes sp. NPDC049681 TaxID=3363905 RepID=UPI003798CD6A
MSATRPPHWTGPYAPTAALPTVGEGTRHQNPDESGVGPDRSRRFMWAAVTGAIVMTVFAAFTVWRVSSGSEPADPPAAQAPAPAVASSAPADVETPSPSPSASPSPSRTPVRQSRNPAELIAGMRTTIQESVRSGQLSRDGGRELNRRLDEAVERLGRGKPGKSRQKLREFTRKLLDLRKEGEISEPVFQSLATQLSALADTW